MEQYPASDPTWSPDGKLLAFGYNNPVNPEQISVGLFDFKTRQVSQLPGSQRVFGPRWSPDGRFVAALAADNSKLKLFDVQTEQWRQFLAGLDQLGYMEWSPDSAYIYFDNLVVTRDPGFFRMRIKDSKLERIANLSDFRAFPSQWGAGSWTGLAPGEIPLFVHDISVQEIYALDVEFP